ncbi:MAG: hypothetical protein DIU60_004165 [Actinomycetes bacterium]|jgi:hypothetical protein|nr:MAG: hypothetical protein DIU60_18390 [Actinomycetota bacterium]
MWNSPPTRLARWLGLDRNPLRRTSDRVECALRLIALLAVAIAVVIGIGMGTRAYDEGVRAEQEQKRTRYRTQAVLLQDLVRPGMTPAGGVVPGRARAQWAAPDGTLRRGLVDVDPGRRVGDTVLIWVDARGVQTRPPQDRGATTAAAISTGAAPPFVTLAVATLLLTATRLINQRLAARQWEAEWRAVEPTWRHHI